MNNQDSTNNSSDSGGGNGNGRGFASMDPQKQREIASKGGRAAHALGKAHEFTPKEAKAAGQKGGRSRGRQNES